MSLLFLDLCINYASISCFFFCSRQSEYNYSINWIILCLFKSIFANLFKSLFTSLFMASNPIFIKDNEVYSKSDFIVPASHAEDIESIMIPSGIISNRIEKMAFDIHEDYHNKDLVFLCVLQGARSFFDDLTKFYDRFQREEKNSIPFLSNDIAVSSYEGTKSTGKIKIIAHNSLDNIRGRDVVVVEDIVDSARTMLGYTDEAGVKYEGLLDHLTDNYNPKSVSVASLVSKRTNLNITGYMPDYAGFSIPNKFIVGCGMDYNEQLRKLPHICIISPLGIEKYK